MQGDVRVADRRAHRSPFAGREPSPLIPGIRIRGIVLAIHLVHVLAMAVIVGGALAGALAQSSRRLEATLWAAMGAIVVTGVGNVGAYGEGLPGTGTRWGTLLLVKMVLVVAVLGVSLRRSMHVWAGRPASLAYWTTAALAAIVASIGVWLAHG